MNVMNNFKSIKVLLQLSNVSAKVYHIASLLGLFPAQLLAVYGGSTLRSMQDVIENNHISSTTYIFAGAQVRLTLNQFV